MTESSYFGADALNFVSLGLKATASYLFLATDNADQCADCSDRENKTHDRIMQIQARQLADHIVELQKPLFIDDIYAHPLIRRSDIVFGHSLRSFAGVPIAYGSDRVRCVLCIVDKRMRRWSNEDMAALQNAAKWMPTSLDEIECA